VTSRRRWTLRLASVVAWLAAWQVVGGMVTPVLLSTPSAVAAAIPGMIRDGSLPSALGDSLVVLGLGLATGTIAGIVIGLAAGRNSSLAALLELPMNALYAVPAVTLIPVITLWFGFETTARTVVVFVFVVFPVLFSTMRGVREVDPDLVEVTRSFCSPERRTWRDLILPSALPYIVTGIRLAIGRALIGVIVAEFYTALSGLGHLIAADANSFQTNQMWVPVVVIALLGIVLTALLEWAERHLAAWRK
jgi:ABC-type nitrate/sulfonate/bicarbonate transport system permease component